MKIEKTKKNPSPQNLRTLSPLPQSPARWKWMAGSTAVAGVAAATTANAANVQITQVDSQFTSTGVDTLKADVTGDGISDLIGLGGYASIAPYTSTFGTVIYKRLNNRANVSSSYGRFGSASYRNRLRFKTTAPTVATSSNPYFSVRAGRSGYDYGTGVKDESGLARVTFSDSRINGGNLTGALLEVRSFNTSPTLQTIQLVRLYFNDSATQFPTGVVAGDAHPAFVPKPPAPDNSAEIAVQKKKCDKLKKKLKKATGAKKRTLSKKLKKCKAKLRALS